MERMSDARGMKMSLGKIQILAFSRGTTGIQYRLLETNV